MDRKGVTGNAPERLRNKREELTFVLLGFFLDAVASNEVFNWKVFSSGLDRILLEESLRLSGGNGRKAAALAGLPYQTFMNRVQKLKNGKPARPVFRDPAEKNS